MVAVLRNLESYSARSQADNSSTSARILHKLSTHCDVKVRTAVADNKNTKRQTSMQLALDMDPDLRYALAENHNLSKGVLELLTNDTNPYVADRAQRTLERLAKQIFPTILLRPRYLG